MSDVSRIKSCWVAYQCPQQKFYSEKQNSCLPFNYQETFSPSLVDDCSWIFWNFYFLLFKMGKSRRYSNVILNKNSSKFTSALVHNAVTFEQDIVKAL